MTLIVRCSCYPEKQDENFPFIVYLSFPPKCRWSIGSCRISYHFHELGEILNGCLVKERKFVYSGARRGSAKGQPNSNRTSCSLACREKKECNLFMLDNKSKTCYLLRGGTMASSEASSAGFCPKSKFYKIQMNFHHYMSTNQANQVIWTTKSNSSLPSPPWSARKETRPRFASSRLSSRARPSGIVWRGRKDQFATWTTPSKSKHLRIPTTSTSAENALQVSLVDRPTTKALTSKTTAVRAFTEGQTQRMSARHFAIWQRGAISSITIQNWSGASSNMASVKNRQRLEDTLVKKVVKVT